MVKKWEVVELGPGGTGISKDAEHTPDGFGSCSPICCLRMETDDARLIVAAVNALLVAAERVNVEPLEYAAAVLAGDVDLGGRVTVEIEGGPLLEGMKGGGILKGRTFHFETKDLETVKRLIDWDKTPSGQQDTFLELMGSNDEA